MAAQRRSPEEVAKSMEAAKKIKAQQVLKQQRNYIKYAQWALFAIGILQLIVALLLFFVWNIYPLLGLIIDGAVGLLFIGLYFLSLEKPRLAFNVGLGVYGTLQLIMILADNKNLVNGFIIKIIIFSTLFSGLSALKRIPPSLLNKKENNDLIDSPISDKDLI
jgi:uncharacterized membrane protein